MAMEERKQVLEMLASGRISVEEATRLLEAVEAPGGPGIVPAGDPGRRGRAIRVRVIENGKQKVNVNVPFGLAKIFLKLAGNEAFGKHDKFKGLDVDEIIRQVEAGLTGKIVEVNDGNDLVEVYVE